MRLLLFTLAFAISFLSYSQIPTFDNEDDVIYPPYSEKSYNCSHSSNAYYNRYDLFENYIPTDITPIKTIVVNLVIMQRDDGTGNFQNIAPGLIDSDDYGVERLLQIYNWFTPRYSTMNRSDIIPNVDLLTDSRFRFELNNIYFYQDDVGRNSNDLVYLQDIVRNETPASVYYGSNIYPNPQDLKELNIFLTESTGSSHATLPDMSLAWWQSYQVICGGYNEFAPDPTIGDYGLSGGIAHEMAHNLDLCHTYLGGGCPTNVATMITSKNWFEDVFGLPSPGNAPHVASELFPESPTTVSWNADPYDNTYAYADRVTNNMMGNQSGHRRYLSPLQLGRVHRAAYLTTLRKYIKDDAYDINSPIVVSTDEDWRFWIRLYQDLVVNNNSICNLTCHLEMPYQAKIIIENGSTLIVDDCNVTGVNQVKWTGMIEVMPGGTLIMKNNSLINIGGNGSIIIHEGAQLIYEGGEIRLVDDNSVLQIDGDFQMSNNVTFEIDNSNAGYILVNSPNAKIQGSSSEFIITGSNLNDKILEFGNNGKLHVMLDVGLFKLKRGGIIYNDPSWMGYYNERIWSEADYNYFWACKFTNPGSSAGTGKIHVTHKTDIINCIFEFSEIEASFAGSTEKLYIFNCDIIECGNGDGNAITTTGGGVTLSNVDFFNNEYTSWYAIHPTLPCKVVGCNFNGDYLMDGFYSENGIVFENSTSGTDLYVKSSNFSDYFYDGIHFTGLGTLILRCNVIENNDYHGVYIGDGAVLDASPEFLGGYNSINNNGEVGVNGPGGNIRLNNASDILLNNGNNEIYQTTSSYHFHRLIQGTLNQFISSQLIPANNNLWNNTGNTTMPSNDWYSIKYNYMGTYISYYLDGTAISPVGNCPLTTIDENFNEFDAVSALTISINKSGQTFNLPYHDAIKMAINTMEVVDSTSDDLVAIDLFNQILLNDIDENNYDEKWLQDLAYRKMNQSLYSAFDNEKILQVDSTGQIPIPVQQVLDVHDYLTNTNITSDNYMSIYNKEIGKGDIYMLAGMLNDAIDQYNSIDICYLEEREIAIVKDRLSYTDATAKIVSLEEPVENFKLLYQKPEILVYKPTKIDSTANLSTTVSIGESVIIGSNTTIGENVVISDESTIGNDVTLSNNVNIGENVVIGDNTVIGKNITIGDGTVIKNDVILDKDCEIGENVCLALGVEIDKEVKLGDYVIVDTNVKLKKNIEISDGAYIGKDVVLDKEILIGTNSIIQNDVSLDKGIEIGNNNQIEKDVNIKKETVTGTDVIIKEGINIGKSVSITDYQTVNQNIGNNGQSGTNPITPPATPFTVDHNCSFAFYNSKIDDVFKNGFTVESELVNPTEIYHNLNTLFEPEILSTFYIWEFGDCESSTEDNPVHQFEKPGTYVINITTNEKCDTIINTGAITVHPNPETGIIPVYQGVCGNNNEVFFNIEHDFSDILTLPCITDTVECSTFTILDTSLYKVKYIWNFGDLSTSYEQIYLLIDLVENNVNQVSHTYAQNGEFELQLTASLQKKDLLTNEWVDMQYSVTTTKKVYISYINADFEIISSVCIEDSLQFNNLTQGIEPFTFSWDFGNGTMLNESNPSTVYNNSGNYNIQLIVQDSIGCQDTIIKTITIDEKIDADFICDSIICINDVLQLINNTQGIGRESYLWDFGDGNTSTEIIPSYSYTSSGVFTITLQVTSYEGCITESSSNVSVIDCPVIDGILYESDFCGGFPFMFDTLILIDTNNVIVNSVDYAVTNENGEFKFNGLQLSNLPSTELYSINTKSGYSLDNIPYLTINEWSNLSPIELYLKTRNLEWNVIYSGTDSIYNVGTVIDLYDNIIVAGISLNNITGYDFVIIKYDPLGNEIWSRTYDYSFHMGDVLADIDIDTQGNVFVTGYCRNPSNLDLVTLKYDNNGNLLWEKIYIDISTSHEIPFSIDVDNNGDVYVTATTIGNGYDDQIMLKYDNYGNLLWEKRYDHNNLSNRSVASCLDKSGNIVTIGACENEIVLLKYNKFGLLVWNKVLTYNNTSRAVDIKVDNDNNIILAIMTTIMQGVIEYDYLVVKLDSSGNEIWSHTFSPQAGSFDSPTSLAIDSANSIIISGKSDEYITILKYSSNGILEWFDQSLIGYPSAMKLDDNQDIYITGYAKDPVITKKSRLLTAKYSQNGVLDWFEEYLLFDGFISSNQGRDIIVSSNMNVYSTGMAYNGNNFDIVTLKYSQCPFASNLKITSTGLQYDNQGDEQSIPLNSFVIDNILIFPNPADNSLAVIGNGMRSIEILDITGKLIVQQKCNSNKLEIEVSNITSGIYFIKVFTEKEVYTEKIIIE